MKNKFIFKTYRQKNLVFQAKSTMYVKFAFGEIICYNGKDLLRDKGR